MKPSASAGRLELMVPPDVVWVAIAGVMWLVARVTPRFGAGHAFRIPLALALFAVGAILIVKARVDLNRAGTTWHPTQPGQATALVATGTFRFSRNPTYLGMEIVLLGWAVVLASPAAALVSAVFVAWIDRFQIRPEEITLADLFGEDYREYQQRVRRWL